MKNSDPDESRKFYKYVANVLTNRGYKLHDYTKALICLFVGYMLKEDSSLEYAQKFFNKEKPINLAKGIMLISNCGTGKTSIFEQSRQILTDWDVEKRLRFKKYRHEQLNSDALENGLSILKGYSKPEKILLDNLTDQAKIKHYGQDMNVLEAFILKRYEQFKEFGYITHFTTDITISEIRKNYSDRVVSRLREMCNIIVIDSEIDNRV